MNRRRLLLLSLVGVALPGPLLAQESEMASGVRAFFAGKMTEALEHWDRQIAADPEAGPHHWQRGLALYYAGKFKEGRAQFESHQRVNPQDVENAVWHFLCVSKSESVEAARMVFIPIAGDLRVPMKEIHALFAGQGTVEAVLAAAEKEAAADPSEGRNTKCYAHLYLGLYAEAQGREAEAKTHLLKSAYEFRMEHYMGRVAQVHCELRGWKPVD